MGDIPAANFWLLATPKLASWPEAMLLLTWFAYWKLLFVDLHYWLVDPTSGSGNQYTHTHTKLAWDRVQLSLLLPHIASELCISWTHDESFRGPLNNPSRGPNLAGIFNLHPMCMIAPALASRLSAVGLPETRAGAGASGWQRLSSS